MGFAILLTAGLSFVGAGVSPPTPELGSMVSTGAQSMIIGIWWPSLFPGIALGIVVFSFAAAGEALAHLLEPHSADAEGSAARREAGIAVGVGAAAGDRRHVRGQRGRRARSAGRRGVRSAADRCAHRGRWLGVVGPVGRVVRPWPGAASGFSCSRSTT